MTPAETIERTLWDLFWLPTDATVVDRPELLFVTCPRPTPYLNMVLRARGACLPELVTEVEERMAGRRARWLVTDTFDRAPLEHVLRARGWEPGDRHEVRILDVGTWTREPPMEVHAIDSMRRLLDACAVNDAAFRPTPHTREELDLDLRACTEGGRVHRFVAYDAGVPVASGGLTAFPDLGFGLLWAGGVVPEARGRGAYLSVLAARIARARQLGLRQVGLYGKVATSAPIVARLGFSCHGEMSYWEKAIPG